MLPRTSCGLRLTRGDVCASHSHRDGLDVQPRVTMRLLRYSKINVTMEIYTEVPSDATRDALRKPGDWLT